MAIFSSEPVETGLLIHARRDCICVSSTAIGGNESTVDHRLDNDTNNGTILTVGPMLGRKEGTNRGPIVALGDCGMLKLGPASHKHLQ